MTNEEIEKRFLFDLEMGVFKKHIPLIKNIDQPVYTFITSDKILKLLNLLENIGYTQISKINNPILVAINTKRKIYGPMSIETEERYNEIPNYISQYSIRKINL